MKAAYVARLTGSPVDNLDVGELPDATAGPGECLVRLTTSSLNHHDLWTLAGVSSRPVTPPQILGCDAVGIVESYAPGTPETVPVGRRVVVYPGRSCGVCASCRYGEPALCRKIGMPSEGQYQGTLAELLPVPASALIPLPDSVSDQDAACLPTAYVTAYRMLFERGGLAPGGTVLIQGASGGVATAALLLARASGATVLCASRDDGKRRRAEELGAIGLSYEKEDLRRALADADAPDGVDVVIETVGEATWQHSLRAVRPGGAVVVAGTTAGSDPPAGLTRVFWFQLTVAGSSGGSPRVLERLVRMVQRGALRPVIDSTVSLDDVAAGFKRLAAGEQFGKIVVSLAG